MSLSLPQTVLQILRAHGPMDLAQIRERCQQKMAANHLGVTVQRLLDGGRITVDERGRYAVPPTPAQPARRDALPGEILELLRQIGPTAPDDVRARLCVASARRFEAALTVLREELRRDNGVLRLRSDRRQRPAAYERVVRLRAKAVQA